ncbi:hypothetical protein TNCV_479501 [Trichonephila clavipes]|nr:hypothetical protein TNCV_479501 [Trichonephila clavipes]
MQLSIHHGATILNSKKNRDSSERRTSRHSCTKFVVDYTIEDALVCDATSKVATTIVYELRDHAAANDIEFLG